jgi:hypothetical protein
VAGEYKSLDTMCHTTDVLSMITPRETGIATTETAIAVLINEVSGKFQGVGIDARIGALAQRSR